MGAPLWRSPTAPVVPAAFLNLPEHSHGTTTVESKTNFLRGVREGYIEAVSRPLHIGRTVVVVETDVHDQNECLVAARHADATGLHLTAHFLNPERGVPVSGASGCHPGPAGPGRPSRGPRR